MGAFFLSALKQLRQPANCTKHERFCTFFCIIFSLLAARRMQLKVNWQNHRQWDQWVRMSRRSRWERNKRKCLNKLFRIKLQVFINVLCLAERVSVCGS